MVVEHNVVRLDQNVPHQSVYLQPYLNTQEGRIIFLNNLNTKKNKIAQDKCSNIYVKDYRRSFQFKSNHGWFEPDSGNVRIENILCAL